MKRAAVAFLILAALVIHELQAFPWRKKPQGEDTTESFPQDEPVLRRLTFLDTLNRGKELRISERDLGGAVFKQEESAPAGLKEIPNGFRVQCFAGSQIENVRAEKAALESRIRYPVYIVFESPFYKLVVGDFTTREQANAAAAELKKQGYPDAWVVGSKVFVKGK